MELYAEVDRRRAERAAKRAQRRRREERIERKLTPIAKAAKMLLLAIMVYALLFFGCLWASG